MAELCEEVEHLRECPKDKDPTNRFVSSYTNGLRTADTLVQFGDGRVELLGHGVTRVGNFFANTYQHVCATFSQTQRR